MKLSDFNITNQIHGRWCRFILQRYLGQYLERNIELDQLSLDLTNGKLVIRDVNINVHHVNELLASMKLPLKLIDGFVGEIVIEVPWSQLLSNATSLKVKELQLTFQSQEINVDDITSMIGSVVDKLVSSQELARSFYQDAGDNGEALDETDGRDGIKAFTKVIDAIVARFCVDLTDTTIRLENPSSPSAEMCTAIEFRAKSMQFIDEQMKNCRLENQSAEVITSQPQGIGGITNLNKYVNLSGVEFFTDVFSRIDDIPVNIGDNSSSQVLTSMYIRREKLKQKSPTASPHESLHPDLFASTMTSISNFQSCHSSLPFNFSIASTMDSLQVPRGENMLLSNPVKFAEMKDLCEIQIQLHNSDNANADQSDYKVNINVGCKKAVNIFISPSQIDIVKKFGDALSFPSPKGSKSELGKKMEQNDYDVIVRTMEEITMQGTSGNRTNALGGGFGTWGKQDNFTEFTNINLDETLSSRNGNGEGTSGKPYVTLKDNSGRKEGTHVKIHIVSLNVMIPHLDLLSKEYVEMQPRKHHDAVEELHKTSDTFFKNCETLKIQATTQLHSVREHIDRLYPQNHLRFVGTSVTVTYDAEKFTSQEVMQFKLAVNNCDFLEYLTAESSPQEQSRRHYSILDFSEFANPENKEHLTVLYASSNSSDEPQAQITCGDCRIELDLSIVDRLADLIVTRPFFDRPFLNNRLDRMTRNQMHLSEDLFSPTIQKESTSQLKWKITCNQLTLDLRIPIADLRNPRADRLPYRQRNVHPEFVRLCLTECSVDIPLHDDIFKIALACFDLSGEFLGISEEYEIPQEDVKFLYASKQQDQGLVRLEIEYDPRNKSLKATSNVHLPGEADDMSRSYSAPILQNQSKREGPFSQVRRTFCPVNRSDSVSSLEQKEAEMNEEIIQAGSREEMKEYADSTMKLSATVIRFDIPLLRLFVVNHDFLEVLYNRLVNDLALWQPAAPCFRGEEGDHKINAFVDQFHSLRQERDDDDDETAEENVLVDHSMFDRSKSHTFSFCLNVNQGTLLMGTKMKQNGLIVGTGQSVINLNGTQLFTVAGYHGDMNRIFFHFTTNKIAIGHRNCTAFDRKGQIGSNTEVKEFGKFTEDECHVQNIQPTEQFANDENADVIAVAIDIHTRPDQNIKDLLLAIAIRNATIKLKPFRDAGHLWVTQLIDLFTLRDYDIPGYKLPIVTTDLQLHLDNVVIAYDHKNVQPQSNTRLRLVVGQTHVTSSIITNMDIAKFTCIFEETKLWVSNEKKWSQSVRFGNDGPPPKDDSFILSSEIGLLHLDVLQCLLPEERLKERRMPLVEIRCRNDIVSIWVCSDSLVTLINLGTEIAESDAFKRIPEDPIATEDEEDEASTSGLDDTGSETGASLWSKPTSLARMSRDELPRTVEETLQAMIGSAIREQPFKRHETIPVGVDAVEEFSSDFSVNRRNDDSIDIASDRYKMHSLETDDEFCMVDEGIIGTGITGADGEPTVKFIGKGNPDDVYEDSRHFRIPDDWRSDGLGALQETFPPPLLRYAIRDVSVHINLYGGSDFLKEELNPKPYSVEEYRKGQGKGQKIVESTRGGPNRDHSVLVTLEFNKISYLYQLFNKDAPVMCTNLLSIYDIVVRDRLQLSNIKELLYQYSNQGQPRRTCAPILAVRIVESHLQEGRMMVSMLPIKVNMDQDTMTFIQDFVNEVSNSIRLPNEVVQTTANRPMIEVAQAVHKKSSLDKPHTLTMEALTPSPVQPPSPLGDLSYLMNRGNKSPNVDELNSAPPLTASAVSIGNLFGTKMNNRTTSPDDNRSRDAAAPSTSRLYPQAEELEDDDLSVGLNENLFGEVEGDWKNTSEINFDRIAQQPATRTSRDVDDLLAMSTMNGSVHPQYTDDALVDTSTDLPDEVETQTVCDDEETEMEASAAGMEQTDHPIRGQTFFKVFTFSPAVSIFLDYQGKQRFGDKSGTMIGIIKGIGQLNQAEIVLKEIHHRHGLLGVGRCLNHAANEWADDIKNNLPNIIASYGPISPLVQISKGFMDLLWMPVAEMRKEDGHVVKGIQKGVGSFGLSSAAGIVGIAQSAVGILQSIAETVLHEVQPDSAYLNRRNRRITGRAGAPTDFRHGVQLAYGIVSDGVRQTKEDYELTAQEERASGQSGVRSILRFATPAVLRPLVMATQISHQLLGGLRNQLRPDMYQDERHKWRDDEVPGGSRN